MIQFYGKELEVSYSQISIFNVGLSDSFSDWSPQHIEQGFTIRPEAVGILTINQAGKIKTNVDNSEQMLEDAVRIYILPFQVKRGKGVEIATISEGFNVMIPDGEYSLLIQLGNEDSTTDWCSFSFVNTLKLADTPRILKADKQISRRNNLILTANPA